MGKTLYYKGLQLPQLRSFCAVATQGSFTAAARALGLSKPAVWQQVRALERELKVVLLRQGGRSVELTAEGRLLLKLIQPHVSGLDSLARLFEAQRTSLPQALTVASTPYLISHHLPPVVREFARDHPSVRLHLRVDPFTEDVVNVVDHGRVDLGIVPYLREEVRNGNVEYEDLFALRFMLLTAANHPLARKRRVKPADLVQYPIIKAASYNHRALETVLRRHDLLDRMHVVLETSSTDIILKYVALGIGIAVLYLGGKDDRPAGEIRVRPFDAEGIDTLPVALMFRKGAYLPEHVRDFGAIVRRFLGNQV